MKTVRHTMYTYNSYINSNSRVSYVYTANSPNHLYVRLIPLRNTNHLTRFSSPMVCVFVCCVHALTLKNKMKKIFIFSLQLKHPTPSGAAHTSHMYNFTIRTLHTHTRKIYSTHIPASHNPHLLTRTPHTLYLFIHALWVWVSNHPLIWHKPTRFVERANFTYKTIIIHECI